MASRKRNKRNLSLGRKIMIVLVIGLLIGIALVVKNIVSLSIEKRELMEKNSELTDKRDELTAELENVNDLDYIEEQARKLLHMIKPGEILYILNGSGHPKDENGNTDIELPTQPVWNEPEETTETEEVQEEVQSGLITTNPIRGVPEGAPLFCDRKGAGASRYMHCSFRLAQCTEYRKDE